VSCGAIIRVARWWTSRRCGIRVATANSETRIVLRIVGGAAELREMRSHQVCRNTGESAKKTATARLMNLRFDRGEWTRRVEGFGGVVTSSEDD
jgi:hypothetical protein